MTNSDEYTSTLKADKEGFYPVQIDLSTVPTKVSGKDGKQVHQVSV